MKPDLNRYQHMQRLVKIVFRSLVILIVAMSFQYCDKDTVYEKFEAVNAQGWYKSDTVIFHPEIPDTNQLYNFIIHVRHNNDYAYRNLYFFTTTRFPEGGAVEDTIELMLAEKDGTWYGSGFGAILTSSQMIMQGARFHQQGEYQFEFRQAMRAENDSLKGIEDIGIRIEKYN